MAATAASTSSWLISGDSVALAAGHRLRVRDLEEPAARPRDLRDRVVADVAVLARPRRPRPPTRARRRARSVKGGKTRSSPLGSVDARRASRTRSCPCPWSAAIVPASITIAAAGVEVRERDVAGRLRLDDLHARSRSRCRSPRGRTSIRWAGMTRFAASTAVTSVRASTTRLERPDRLGARREHDRRRGQQLQREEPADDDEHDDGEPDPDREAGPDRRPRRPDQRDRRRLAARQRQDAGRRVVVDLQAADRDARDARAFARRRARGRPESGGARGVGSRLRGRSRRLARTAVPPPASPGGDVATPASAPSNAATEGWTVRPAAAASDARRRVGA